MDALEADVVPVPTPSTLFGYRKAGWKRWTLFDGTPVLVPAGFSTESEPNGDILMYPGGPVSPASGRMPGADSTSTRSSAASASRGPARPADNMEEFTPISMRISPTTRRNRSDCRGNRSGLVRRLLLSRASATSPSCRLRGQVSQGDPDVEEWYVSTITRREYVWKVFERQCEVALGNFEKLRTAIGDIPMVVLVTERTSGRSRARSCRRPCTANCSSRSTPR